MVGFSSLFFFSIIILFLTIIVDLGLGVPDHFWSSCSSNGPPIRFPFRIRETEKEQNNQSYPYPGFDISCNDPRTKLELPTLESELFVRNIDYLSQEIQVYENFISIGRGCLVALLLSENSTTRPFKFPFQFKYDHQKKYTSYSLFNCTSIDDNRLPFCNIKLIPSDLELRQDDLAELDEYGLYPSCAKMYDTQSIPDDIYKANSSNNYYATLTWSKPDCRSCEANHKGCRLKKDSDEEVECFDLDCRPCKANHKGCRLKKNSDEVECFDLPTKKRGKGNISVVITCILVMILASFVSYSIAVKATFYLSKLYKDEREHRLRIEKFLEDYSALKPSRYTYADIKRITHQFKCKLGQGAYGTVFKGKLSSDILVAVKILNNSKGNGEEFLNEVATLGQIHHINVVRLVGYCAEGFRRALVYEFLPNYSLDKYISSAASNGNHSLSWETLQDIALGIAKGIEYLHQGCDQRILHFDIKPQNVLLDQNFKPKISDFGLAKLCSRDQSIVSMTTIRGTIGYIAPEVFSKNFANVSYKSDVYSFGMLLLEIVGGRKNTTVTDEIYYPEWIYNLLEGGEDLRIQIEEEGDAKIAKKLAIVGLWCIQWHPMGRPTMKVVVQMLEGVEVLNMPPNPSVSRGQLITNTEMPSRLVTPDLEAIAE